MNIIKLSAVCLSVLVFITSCGGGGSDSGGSSSKACSAFKVLNGDECSSDALPVVKLEIIGVGTCTGTIISNDDVLTAAHCVENAHSVTAVHDRGSQVAVAGIANPLFSVAGAAFDIGLLRFPNIATNFNLSPAHFDGTNRIAEGDTIKVVGYGKDGTPSLANGNPRGVELLVTAVEGGGIFAVFDQNNAGACSGDSGGGVTHNGLIVGTVHGGISPGGCAEGTINIFTDMQANGNVDFVRQHVPSAVFE